MRPLLDGCCSRHVARKHILRLRLRLAKVSQQREQELAIEHVEQYGVDTQLLESGVLQRELLFNQRKRIQSFAWRQGTREKVPGRSQAFLAVVTSPHSRIPAGPCDDGVMATHDPLELRDMRKLFWCKLFWCTQDERVCFWEDVCRTSVASCCSLCHPTPMDHLTISSARTQPLMCLQRGSKSM